MWSIVIRSVYVILTTTSERRLPLAWLGSCRMGEPHRLAVCHVDQAPSLTRCVLLTRPPLQSLS